MSSPADPDYFFVQYTEIGLAPHPETCASGECGIRRPPVPLAGRTAPAKRQPQTERRWGAKPMKQELRTILIVVSATLAALVFHHVAEQAQVLAGEILWPGNVELPPVVEGLPAFE